MDSLPIWHACITALVVCFSLPPKAAEEILTTNLINQLDH